MSNEPEEQEKSADELFSEAIDSDNAVDYEKAAAAYEAEGSPEDAENVRILAP